MKLNKNIIKSVIGWVIVIALIAWVWSRWDVWFSNPPEPAYRTPSHVNRLVTTWTSSDNRIFSWIYGETPVDGVLEMASVHSNDTVQVKATSTLHASRSGQSVYYKAVVENLQPTSEYRYRIIHPQDTTEWKTFRTHSDKEKLEFIYVGDIQDNHKGIAKPFFQEIDSRYPDMSLYVLVGDIIERPTDAYWNEWYEAMAPIAEKTPILAAAGNHEFLKGFPPELEERFYLTYPIFERENSGGNACAQIQVGEVDFFILDSNKEFWTYFAQRSWLKNKMKDSQAKWKIVVLHHPIYSARGTFNNIFQRMAFNSIIKEYGAALVLQGHEHVYMRKATVDDAQHATIPVYVTSNSSPKNYRIKSKDETRKYGENDRFYQHITVSGDTLSMETYNSAHQLYDKVILVDSCGVKEVILP